MTLSFMLDYEQVYKPSSVLDGHLSTISVAWYL